VAAPAQVNAPAAAAVASPAQVNAPAAAAVAAPAQSITSSVTKNVAGVAHTAHSVHSSQAVHIHKPSHSPHSDHTANAAPSNFHNTYGTIEGGGVFVDSCEDCEVKSVIVNTNGHRGGA
jgi:hypothetical protein